MESTVKNIMEKHVVSVHPDTPVLEAHTLLEKNRFDGVPVVDAENHLLGILTEYDLLTKGTSLHLPTFQKMVAELPVFKKDRSEFSEHIEQLKNLTVQDVMNTDPLALDENTSFEEVIAAFRDHHRVNPVPVINADRTVIGVVSRYDILKLFDLLKPVS